MIAIIAELSVPAEARERLLALVQTMDVETNREDGCLYYRHARDVSREQTIVLSELWRDQEALLSHFRTPHFTAFRQLARETGVRTRIRVIDGREIDKDAPDHVRALLARIDAEPV